MLEILYIYETARLYNIYKDKYFRKFYIFIS